MPAIRVVTTERVQSAIKMAIIAVGIRILPVSIISCPSGMRIAGVMIAVNTAIGTKRIASTQSCGIVFGINSEIGKKRIRNVKKPQMKILAQIIMSLFLPS